MTPPLDVCLSVDVEGDVNGHFADPEGRAPLLLEAVWRMVDGRSHGLGFLLEPLRQHHLPATFFVEMAQYFCFGGEIMARIVQTIRQEPVGHDVQLHYHPAWRWFALPDGRERLRAGETPRDTLTEMTTAQLTPLLEEAWALFHGMTGTIPRGFRSGNLMAGGNLHAALGAVGFRFSSCIGAGYHPSPDPALHLAGGVHPLHGVREIPVTSYRLLPWSAAPWRILTVAGTPWDEMRHLLELAAQLQAGPVVILTHPSEFAHKQPGDGRAYLPRPAIQERWRKLCALLASDPERWRVIPMAMGAEQWPDHPMTPGISPLHGRLTGLWQRWRENR